jgi:hypothetical protein
MDTFAEPGNSDANLLGKVTLTVFIRQFDCSDPYASSVVEIAWFEGEPLICVKAPKKMQEIAIGLTLKDFLLLANKLGFTCGKPRVFTMDGMEELTIKID